MSNTARVTLTAGVRANSMAAQNTSTTESASYAITHTLYLASSHAGYLSLGVFYPENALNCWLTYLINPMAKGTVNNKVSSFQSER